jgi:hypothetical protein
VHMAAIGTKRTLVGAPQMSAFGGKADISPDGLSEQISPRRATTALPELLT